jgi:hypothetical protein
MITLLGSGEKKGLSLLIVIAMARIVFIKYLDNTFLITTNSRDKV